ncbi:MAG: DNA polymerase IV, partial [Syntrophorhabdales bacterium]
IRLRKSVRLLGISLSNIGQDGEQMLLFQEEDREKKAALTKAVDTVNDKFGEHAVTFASTVTQEKEQRVISPSWRPSGVRKSDV